MQHLGSLLSTLPLPDRAAVAASAHAEERSTEERSTEERSTEERSTEERSAEAAAACDRSLLVELGGDLPAGHLHVWGGPSGVGKTSFLLSLLHGAAVRSRPVVYATYDLSAPSLALRLLAMLAEVDVTALPDPGGAPDTGRLTPTETKRVVGVRQRLAALPFYVLPARGFSVVSLADRLARAPVRPQVLVVDYLQAVIRERGTDVGAALRDLAALAVQRHVAVVGVFRATPSASGGSDDGTDDQAEPAMQEVHRSRVAARVGWIAPIETSRAGERPGEGGEAGARGDSGMRQAAVVRNRYGHRPSVPLYIDPVSGHVQPELAPRDPAPSELASLGPTRSDGGGPNAGASDEGAGASDTAEGGVRK